MKKISIMIAAVIVLLPIASKANHIDVNLLEKEGSHVGVGKITVGGATPNTGITVKANKEDKTQETISSNGAKTGVKGDWAGDFPTGLPNLTCSIDITIGGETWKGISTCSNFTSEEQKRKAAEQQSIPESLPFDSFGSFFNSDDNRYGQIQVINQDAEYSYEFSQLMIYADLDKLYYDTEDFASSEAIATGRLASDVVEETLMEKIEVAPIGQEASNIITVPSGIVNDTEKYVLLKGTTHKIDSLGNPIGSDIDFSIAIIPEPATMVLLGLGGLAFLRRRRQGS